MDIFPELLSTPQFAGLSRKQFPKKNLYFDLDQNIGLKLVLLYGYTICLKNRAIKSETTRNLKLPGLIVNTFV